MVSPKAIKPVLLGTPPIFIGIPLLVLVLGAGTPGPKQSKTGFAAPAEQPVRVELIAEHGSVQPGGATRVGVHFDLEEGWHIYAKEPGEAGLPTKITWGVTWRGPGGASLGPLNWPTPQRLMDPGNLRTFGYTGVLVLASRLTVSRDTGPGTPLPIHAKVEWLACKSLCVPGSADLHLTLPVSTNPPVFSTHAEFFEHIN